MNKLDKLNAKFDRLIDMMRKGSAPAVPTPTKNDGVDVAQADLLALQAKIQSWGNLTSTATGILRAIGDSLKSTTQNIR